MSSGIEFRKDEEVVRLAQVFVDGKCAVEVPPEGMHGHGKVVGAFYVDKHISYALLFADGHEHGGYGERWWGNTPLPPSPSDVVEPVQQVVPEDSVQAPVESPVVPEAVAAVLAQVEVSSLVLTPVETVVVVAREPPRIVTVVPFAPDGDLGKYYNDFMRQLGEDDWACFLDHDAVHTTRKWHGILEKAVEDHPEAGLFGAVTNRVGSADQEVPGVDRNDHDMVLHRKVGHEIASGKYLPMKDWDEYVDMAHPGRNWLAGVLMLTSKKAWKRARALDASGAEICGFFEGALFGVDNAYHKAVVNAGMKVYLLSRLYVYHWYRANGDEEHVRRLAPTRTYQQ